MVLSADGNGIDRVKVRVGCARVTGINGLGLFVALIGLSLVSGALYGYQMAASRGEAGGAADVAAMSRQQLQALVAPIALYPDPLVAQVLGAATFPDQVAVADYWLQQNRSQAGVTLMESVNKQPWNASVKALTQFPSVLDNMAKNLNWTSSLGQAYHDQASEVMEAIQTLRAQAKANGSLKSGPQITVTQESPQIIAIMPSAPEVVYVPQYNPAMIYGVPYITPGYAASDVAAGSLLGFGAGVAVGAMTSGNCCSWGWGSWATDWRGGTVVYNHNNFYGNSAWHGGYYNGAYHNGWGYRNAYNRSDTSYGEFANRADEANREMPRSVESDRMDANSWARMDNSFRSSNAFSGLDDRFGGGRGWQSMASSFRGWGSMRAGGFAGGRFGGDHFGGGGFRGGFRR